MIDRSHSHEYDGPTSFDNMHMHFYKGTTMINENYTDHIHDIIDYTTTDDGHRHKIEIKTGYAINVRGGHIHSFKGWTSSNGSHDHYFSGYTSIS